MAMLKTAHQRDANDAADGKFVCPVCLEIFIRPMTTQCGHTFCQSCLQECLRPQKAVCAVCRSDLSKWTKADALEELIHRSSGRCKGCGNEVPLSQMRSHTETCSKYQDYLKEVQCRNRFTFTCPYCDLPNFDQDGLLEHCTSRHTHDSRPVVCPICASMPGVTPITGAPTSFSTSE